MTQPAHLQGAGRLINQDNIQSIKNDEDIEHVRAKALYYLELAHGLQQSKYEEADRKYYDVRLLSTFAIIAFLVETIMIALWQSKTLSKTSPKGESA
ncbi:MAG TPA: hypothetical protein VN667_15020 [Burkholderiales bacterium]|nr:hypothetical protein [Burkholderiales bacterium]